MNQESISKQTKHVNDVDRIKTDLEKLTTEEINKLINDRQQNVSMRWEQCSRCFKMLFTVLNNGNHLPVDSFDIRLGQESINGSNVDTFVRIWHDRRDNSFKVRPFTRNGPIEDHEFTGEKFSDNYTYRYGTYLSKAASLSIDHDSPDPTIRLNRLEGKLISDNNLNTKAVFLSALNNHISPLISSTEETLSLIKQSVVNGNLNPDYAAKFLQIQR